MSRATFLRVAMIIGLISGSAVTALAQTPGTIPGNRGGLSARPNALPEAASGLGVFYRKYGKYQLSVDAKGSNAASHKVSVQKPAKDAVVDKAFLLAASNNNSTVDNGDVVFDGKSITWSNSVFNGISGNATFFNSVLADVTKIVKPKMDAMNAAGKKTFTIKENIGKTSGIDGEILVVVFKMKTGTNQTVALLFGAQQLAGDRFEIAMEEAINPASSRAVLNMGLGISYSYQGNGTQQYSTINVNGNRLTTSAGGEDDGAGENGALITVGGIGDKTNTPADPNATPTDARSDDEKYSLLKYITKTTKTINVDTLNPSNDDNIFFGWFEFSAKGEINKDTDGDGLLDSWEKKGYDHDGDGVIDVNLPQLGANYKHKDLFIAYAYMAKGPTDSANHKPSSTTLSHVTNAFKNAPVSNPDGKSGIKVHWKNLGQVPFTDNLNVSSSNWAEFETIMDPLVSPAERVIYHRLLFASHYDGGNSSGISRGIPGSDFLVTLPPDFGSGRIAGTIMHELGHNLGLRHGNVDDTNYKANHLSIMSYLNQFDWLIKDGKPKLDYERFSLKDLDENNLNEAGGLSRTSGGDSAISHYGVRWNLGGTINVKNSSADKNVNWNKTGASNQHNVIADINNDGGTAVLEAGSIEWENLIFDGGLIGASGGASKTARNRFEMMLTPDALKELTIDEYLKMKKNEVEVVE